MTYNPGLVNYDTVNQVLDFMDGVSAVPFGYVGGQEEVVVQYNAHHPVFVTLIFGTFIKIGVILGNPSVGLFMYIIGNSAIGQKVLIKIAMHIENSIHVAI